MTKILLPSPDAILAPGTSFPRFGTYRGGLPPVFLGSRARNPIAQIRNEKRWMYFVVVTDEVVFAAATVRLGYAANAFAFVVDRKANRTLADVTALGPRHAASVNERAGDGHASSFDFLGKRIALRRPLNHDAYSLEMRFGELAVEASIKASSAPPAVGVVAELGSGLFSTTEKRALLDVSGELAVGSKRFSLDGGFAGYDFTMGLLERHTAWRWGFGLGRARDGSRVAFNVTEGFVGERECVVWRENEVFPIGPVGISFSASDPLQRWRVQGEGDALSLDFEPIGKHEENKNLGLVRSRFLQVNGHFRGRIALPEQQVLEVDALPGVTEEQDTFW